MNRLKSKTMATLLIAMFMISALAFVSAGVIDPAGDIFWDSTARWTQADYKAGVWSVQINYEEPTDGCIIVPVNLPLSLITSKTSNYWFKLITTDDPKGPDYPNYGEVILMIDVDGDGVYEHGAGGPDDYLFGEWVYYDTGVAGDSIPIATHDWVQLDLNDPLLGYWDRYVGSQAPGDDLRPLSWFAENDDTGGVGDEREPFDPGTDGVDITGDSIVMYICIQAWQGYEAYIDGMTMGGAEFAIEPSHALGMTASVVEYTPPSISITVTPTSVDFETVVQGGVSATKTVKVTNTGDVSVDVTTSFIEDGDFYATKLDMSPAGPHTIPLSPGYLDIEMFIDLTGDFGFTASTYTGTLVFWAEETPP